MKKNIKEQQLIETLHLALHNSNIREFSEIKDFYKNIEYRDLTKLSKSKISKSIKIFKWVVENPDYGFNQLFENYYENKFGYTDNDLYNYFKLYYKNLKFCLVKYERKEFIIRFSDFKKY